MAPRKDEFGRLGDDWKLGPNVCVRIIVRRMDQGIGTTRVHTNSLPSNHIKTLTTGEVFRKLSELKKIAESRTCQDRGRQVLL